MAFDRSCSSRKTSYSRLQGCELQVNAGPAGKSVLMLAQMSSADVEGGRIVERWHRDVSLPWTENINMTFRAIVWDCDGVLIDSELLACKVVADCYTRAGYSLTASEYIERFFGQSRVGVAAIIRQETGEDLAAAVDWAQVDAARKAAFEGNLRAVQGVMHLLQQAFARKIRMAVASGSELERLEHSLKLARLWDLLAPHIYSTEQVTRGKPAPDIYLFAANKLGVHPSECLVIEDSQHGTIAGKTAGMTVYGFIGGSHCSPGLGVRLQRAGADAVFSDMPSLQAALRL